MVTNEIYKIVDWYSPNNITVSLTTLRERKSTRGHSHADQSEIYYFLDAIDSRMIACGEEYAVK